MQPALTQAWHLHQSGRMAAAERAYETILADASDDADALNCYGILLMQTTRSEQALAMFRRAATLKPDDPGIPGNLARAALAVGDPAIALAAAERAIANGANNPGNWQLLGNALKEMNRIDDAIAAFETGRQRFPDDFLLHYNVAICQQMAGRDEEAERHFRAILARRPNHPQAWFGLGNALAAMARLDDAEAAYRRVLRDRPNLAQAWINLGLVLTRRGSAEPAADAFREALRLEPANQSALAALATVSERDASVLLDFDSILIAGALPPGADLDQERFNAALASEILALPALQKDPHHKTTRGGFQTGNLALSESPALAAFVVALRAEIERRLDTMAQRYATQAHPLAGSRPTRWRLNLWATVLEHEGHQDPHLHPAGWLSGVYYVALPAVQESSQAGWLELGRAPELLPARADAPVRLHRPQLGALLTFPSYLYHRTLPHAASEPRISLAFDAIPIA